MYSIPKLELFYEETTGRYLIQNYMEHPEFGYSMATGDFICISTQEMSKCGAEIVLENLHAYQGRRESETSALEKMSIREKRTFYKQYFRFGLSLDSPSVLTISPMEIEADGSGIGDRSREVRLNLPCTSDEFIAALSRAMTKRSE